MVGGVVLGKQEEVVGGGVSTGADVSQNFSEIDPCATCT